MGNIYSIQVSVSLPSNGPETRRVHRQLARHAGQRQLRRRIQRPTDEDGAEGGGEADQDREGRGWKHSDAGDQTVRPSAETPQLDQSARLPLQRPRLLDGDGVLRGGRPAETLLDFRYILRDGDGV